MSIDSIYIFIYTLVYYTITVIYIISNSVSFINSVSIFTGEADKPGKERLQFLELYILEHTVKRHIELIRTMWTCISPNSFTHSQVGSVKNDKSEKQVQHNSCPHIKN